MPEGHVLHRLAHRFNAEFRGQPLSVTSPQGRFPEAALVDATVLERADAIGKHLFLHFSNGHIIHIHLGLIGHFTFEDLDNFRGQIRLRVANREQAANLRGPQWCRLITDDDYARVCEKAGEDPLRDDASPDAVFARVRRSRRTIGSLLMDQQRYAGVGNIYRAETLFRQGISPFRAGRDCSLGELRAVWDDLVELMRIGVSRGRIDTVRDEHSPEAMDRPPRKDDHGGEVYVYRRAGDPCYVCGTPIASAVVEGRNLFWCPDCQGE